MNNWKTYVIISMFLVICAFGVIMCIRYHNLLQENESLRIENTTVLDSFKTENERLLNYILELDKTISKLNGQVDSLETIKQKIIIKKEYLPVSVTITESAELLKKNIQCER